MIFTAFTHDKKYYLDFKIKIKFLFRLRRKLPSIFDDRRSFVKGIIV